MSTRHYLAALRHYWLIVAAAAVLGGLAGLGLSLAATPLYTATTKLYFSPSFGDTANDLNQGSSYTQSQMLSFAELAESPAVLDEVISNLGLDTTSQALASSIAVTIPQNTVILDAAVTNADAALAARIANEFARSLTAAVTKIAPVTVEKHSAVSVTVIARAITPMDPSSPDTRRNALLGTLIGLIAGILAFMLRERLDQRVRSAEALATVTSSALLGTLARTRRHARPPAASDGSTQLSESYRRMSVRLTAAGDPGRKLSFLVTSAIPDEGKNRVALGLARAFAERGRRVVLVDADIRQPTIAGIAGLDDTGGLTGMLGGTTDAAAAVQKWGPTGLDVLVAGPAASRPADLMASPAMADAIGRFRKRYDVLVIGTAPINPVADAVILGSLVDGVVVVVDSTRVLRSQLTEAIDSLQDSNIPVLGVVLDRAPRRRGTGTYHVAGTSSGSKDSLWRTLRGRLDASARRSLPATELTGDTDKAPDERNDWSSSALTRIRR